jgi:UDP-glucose 4-epimerase
MNILIIGSDSFIARNFKEHFREHFNIKGISRCEVHQSDEVEIKDLFQIPEEYFFDIDVVINFAAIVHQPQIRDTEIYNEVNHRLAIFNAQKAKDTGVKHFIQMSTIAVYGNTPVISIETPYNPINAYGSSKLNADLELLKMQDAKFIVSIIRPPMVYGGGNAPGNMKRLIKLVDKGIPLPFKGIKNHRDFIHIKNLIQYIAYISENRLKGILLLCDNEPVSTEFLLSTISKYGEKSIYLFSIPKILLKILQKIRPKEYDKLFGILEVHSNLLDYTLPVKYSVEHGLAEMVEWYKSNK